ncbi:type VI secretion system contractile sheath small subunit [Pseudomonas sp. GD03860]|uniref:type VI secretion system contractile sheath small subunit n=1 Tax=Pseudomonas TaxID=286 RepID=UPI0023632E4B|nr:MULTISPECIES: type VI secretion system contractile sheath small subunit [Pseudomonas]MDD2058600.1 type VI secretion system contractile sheath small subunit [Pseudomonas putida]MDH0639535.1 type VI secretion system contractile sheath small subunit [Pseudomonas sp. GD03860]
MSSNSGGQKFIAHNRAPRVQIEYEVELYGNDKTIEIPFVNGVLADLSGHKTRSLPPVAEREFLEIDVDNFDDRMRAINPGVQLRVANELTGEGNMEIELDFRSMADFSPGAIAQNIEPLRKLLEARNQLANLLTYMDGKRGAEQLVAQLLRDGALMSAVSERAQLPNESNE